LADPAASGGAFLSSSAIFDAAGGARRNLIVEGRIDAQVPLHAHGVAVASSGRVRGDIHAAIIRVEGEVVGDLFGAVQVRVCYLASVKGDITAPNVIVEEGARFEGQVVMAEPEPLAAPELGGESRVIVNA
jgi:cytoskeletal protein CcmA (bactofilin family)